MLLIDYESISSSYEVHKLTEEGAECEFWGDRIAGGTPRTGLEPFPPWYCREDMALQLVNLLIKIHSTSTEWCSSSVHRIRKLHCITCISVAFGHLKKSMKENGFCISAQAAPRDHSISTSRFNTHKLTLKKKSILSRGLSITWKIFLTPKKSIKHILKLKLIL